MTRRVLVIFAHPFMERSRVNIKLEAAIQDLPHVDMRALYDLYPDYSIDSLTEQAVVEAHDVVVFQYPLYWYTMPALLKEWLDQVFVSGWAYGQGGDKLNGKGLTCALSTGGSAEAYTPAGDHGHALEAFLLPLVRTAAFSGMTWHAPFVVHDAHNLADSALEQHAKRYRAFLMQLQQGSGD